MQIRVEMLDEGDDVLGLSENKLVIKKKSGEVEIFTLTTDEEDLPRIDEKSIFITFGDSKSRKIVIKNPKNNIELGTF